jgi:putative glycosyltransferase
MRIFFVTFNLGWPTTIISIWFLGGFIIFSIGIIGIYLSRVMLEVKERPLYVVKNVYTAKNTVDY